MLRILLTFCLLCLPVTVLADSAQVRNLEGRQFYTIRPESRVGQTAPAGLPTERFMPLKAPARPMALEARKVPFTPSSYVPPAPKDGVKKSAAAMNREQAQQILAIFAHSE